MKLFRRENYLKKIRGFYDDCGMIKVITGIRRCGKSCLMRTVMDELRERGIPDSHIIDINLDRSEFLHIRTATDLNQAIASFMPKEGNAYLFIDEVQNVSGFEQIINAWREEERCSIFITGSNSYLLSGELVTKLTGRYIEIELFPLTFAEYLSMKDFYGKALAPNPAVEFSNYLLEGGFPKIIDYDDPADKRTYVSNLIAEIFEKDIRPQRKIRHVSVFERVRDYIINNFGATTSLQNILDHFTKREHIAIKRETLNRYIGILEAAKIINRCSRFDLKSKRALAGEQKYYLTDLSFYFARNTDNKINYGPVLENIIYLYARSTGCSVSVGRVGKLECDFILRDTEQNYAYVQVARTIAAESTEEREYAPLEMIRDTWPKYVMTTDTLLPRRGGVHHVNLIDFLREERRF